MGQSLDHDHVGVRSRFMKIAHHSFHEFVRSVRRNQALGFVQRNGQGWPQARGRPDKVRGALGTCRVGGGLTDGLAERDAHATVVERPHEAERDRGETDFSSARSKIKRVRHWNEGLS